jgi:FMN phosphatase YigB (HAD superfamily)
MYNCWYSITLCIATVIATPLSAQQPTSSSLNDPTITIIALDLDDVVITGRSNNKNQEWLNDHPKLAYFLQDFFKKNTNADFDYIYSVIKNDHELTEQMLAFEKLLTTADRIEAVIDIVRDLHAAHYVIVAATNMYQSTYKKLIANGTLPNTYFSAEFGFTKSNLLNKKSDGSFYMKPNSEYYEHLKLYVNNHYPERFKYFVMIDDKLENVEAAQKMGMAAILFKNPEQLRADLQALALLSPS